MPEMITVKFDDDEYDRRVQAGPPEMGDLSFTMKDHATVGGLPGAVVSFTIQLPDGTSLPVQATTTVRQLQMLGAMLFSRYGQL